MPSGTDDLDLQAPDVIVRRFEIRDYEPTWRAMQSFTDSRDASTADEIWLLQHPPVFTLGLAGKPEHLLSPGDIPVIACDRGGQVTYHGPGQLIAYVLLNVKRRGLGVRRLVSVLEKSVIDLLADLGIDARARSDAPGVYVDGRKIAALGLRVKRGCSYHGLSLNVDMDLEPFRRINPCGYQGMEVVQLRDLGVTLTPEETGERLLEYLQQNLRAASGR